MVKKLCLTGMVSVVVLMLTALTAQATPIFTYDSLEEGDGIFDISAQMTEVYGFRVITLGAQVYNDSTSDGGINRYIGNRSPQSNNRFFIYFEEPIIDSVSFDYTSNTAFQAGLLRDGKLVEFFYSGEGGSGTVTYNLTSPAHVLGFRGFNFDGGEQETVFGIDNLTVTRDTSAGHSPEPGTILLFSVGLGLVVLMGYRRRKRG